MDLKSGYPFWAISNGLMRAFPPLRQDLACEVAIVGGGISGALIADELATHGHDVALFEERDIAWGSTAASTALLQYEIDTHLIDLAKAYGEANGVLAYQACIDAIALIRDRAKHVGNVGYLPMESLYFASKKTHERTLRQELAMRQRHDMPVSWIGGSEIKERFGFDAPCGLLSHTAAAIDPYRLTYRLLAKWHKRGMTIHDRSTVVSLTPRARSVELAFENGQRVVAKHVVMATGYAAQGHIPVPVARNRSSYAFVTDPLDDRLPDVLRKTMVWETARPYLYMRPTSDGRLLIGGADDNVDVPARRDARVKQKAAQLARKVEKLFPQMSISPAFAWAGTFAETADGLPYFGAYPSHNPRVLYAMAYGGNGISYSMIGAGLLRAAIERRRHPLERLFAFGRLDA